MDLIHNFYDIKPNDEEQKKKKKSENSLLRNEVDIIKQKIANTESSCSSSSPTEFIPQVLQETLEREKCGFNVLAYGVPE